MRTKTLLCFKKKSKMSHFLARSSDNLRQRPRISLFRYGIGTNKDFLNIRHRFNKTPVLPRFYPAGNHSIQTWQAMCMWCVQSLATPTKILFKRK